MTVGVPEINLDTWGLKYVKKKMATGNQQTTGRESDAGGGKHYSTGSDKKLLNKRGVLHIGNKKQSHIISNLYNITIFSKFCSK